MIIVQKFKQMFKKKKPKFFLKDTMAEEIKKGLFTCGKWSYGNPKIYRWSNSSKIHIGNFCSMGPEVSIYVDPDHRLDNITTSPLSEKNFFDKFTKASNDYVFERGDLNIGHDVWIGGHVVIFSGINIGTGAIIGAGSVIRKNVDPYSIVYGNPAKEIGKRFNDNLIAKLLKSQWWNLNDNAINEISNDLLSDDAEALLKKIEKLKNEHK